MADRIGFIGVGTMGEPMCRNLARQSGGPGYGSDRCGLREIVTGAR